MISEGRLAAAARLADTDLVRSGPETPVLARPPLLAIVAAAVLLVPALWFFTDTRLAGVAAGLDRDGSGRLEPDELGPAARADLRSLDRDRSGAVDGAEFRRWVFGRWLSGATRSLAVPPLPERPTPADLRAWLEAPVAAGDLPGVALLVLVDGEVVFRHATGNLAPEQAVPLAAASEWPTAAVLGCLHDRGEIDLEAPLGSFAPGVPEAWAALTPVALLAHTAGTPARGVRVFEPETSVATAGRDLVRATRPVEPGAALRHGGAGLQVAAWWAEVRTGRRWRRLFVECLAWPLSLESAAWGHELAGPAPEGFADAGAGLSMSLDDYGAFLAMLQQRGRYDGVRNLAAATLRLLERDRAGDLPRESLPPAIDPAWGRALGAWCPRRTADGRCTSLLSPGGLGAWPWLDREREVAGILLTVDVLPRIAAWNRATQRLAERIYGRAVLTSDARGPRPGG